MKHEQQTMIYFKLEPKLADKNFKGYKQYIKKKKSHLNEGLVEKKTANPK